MNKFPIKPFKRFSNIKYIELRDIVEMPPPPMQPLYPLLKKSTLSSYAKRVLSDYQQSNLVTQNQLNKVAEAMDEVKTALALTQEQQDIYNRAIKGIDNKCNRQLQMELKRLGGKITVPKEMKLNTRQRV
jgi:hypothetical protein